MAVPANACDSAICMFPRSSIESPACLQRIAQRITDYSCIRILVPRRHQIMHGQYTVKRYIYGTHYSHTHTHTHTHTHAHTHIQTHTHTHTLTHTHMHTHAHTQSQVLSNVICGSLLFTLLRLPPTMHLCFVSELGKFLLHFNSWKANDICDRHLGSTSSISQLRQKL